jgi:hypothetical protein
MREEGWNSLFEEVSVFYAKNNIVVPNMDDMYQPLSRRKAQRMKNSQHYCMELYYTVIDSNSKNFTIALMRRILNYYFVLRA